MRKTSEFNDVLDASDRLSLEEKEALVEVLRHRTLEERRLQLKKEIEISRREYATGKCKVMSPMQIMREMLNTGVAR